MKQATIGSATVGQLGLGCMGMSNVYGSGDEAESLRTLDRALELGVNHWDTADMYGAGHNETLVGRGLAGRRDQIFLATKFGNVVDRPMTSHQDLVADQAPWIVDGTPTYARKCVEASLRRLGTDHIDLYYLHRVDPRTPIEDTVGTMAEFVSTGKIRFIGLSEVSPDTLRRANAVHPISAVQNEFSLWTRDSQKDVLPLCAELGIAYVPYSPLGRGFLTGAIKNLGDLAENDWRRNHPRFQAAAISHNQRIVEEVTAIALRHEATPAQIALAWVLAQGDHVCPIPGTKHVKHLEENGRSAELALPAHDLQALDEISTAEGARYPETAMRFVAR